MSPFHEVIIDLMLVGALILMIMGLSALGIMFYRDFIKTEKGGHGEQDD